MEVAAMRNQLHQCDCGAVHSRTTFLNANTGNWLCAPCVEAIDNRRQRELVKVNGSYCYADPADEAWLNWVAQRDMGGY